MTKTDLMLIAIYSEKETPEFTPVQIQKLFFLIDKNLGDIIGGPYFNFEPYHYGPFDKNVYIEFDNQELIGNVEIGFDKEKRIKTYRLSSKGASLAKKTSDNLDLKVKEYISTLNSYVRSLSFVELVSSIYKAYPDMKVNSIFNK